MSVIFENKTYQRKTCQYQLKYCENHVELKVVNKNKTVREKNSVT